MVQHPFEKSECAGGWWFQRFEMGAHLRCASRIGEGCIPKQNRKNARRRRSAPSLYVLPSATPLRGAGRRWRTPIPPPLPCSPTRAATRRDPSGREDAARRPRRTLCPCRAAATPRRASGVAVDQQRLLESIEHRRQAPTLGRKRELERHRRSDLPLRVHLHHRFHHVVGAVDVFELDFQNRNLLIVGQWTRARAS